MKLVLALVLGLVAAAPASAQMTASEVGEPANGPGVFRFPQALAYTPGGGSLVVGDEYSGRISVYGTTGDLRSTFSSRALAREPGRIGVVGGVATDRAGHVFVLDSENDRVQAFSADGTYIAGWGDSSQINTSPGNAAEDAQGISAGGLAWGDGAVYVADPGFDRVARVPFDGQGFGAATFSTGLGLFNPQGLGLDPSGTRLFIADDDNDRIVVADPSTLAFETSFGGGFQNPYDVAVDAANRLYVADNLNNRVDVFDATSLASLGAFGRGGRGVPGTLAIVRAVGALADDPRGGVAVADTANNRVQTFDTAGNVTAAWGIQGRGPGYVTRPRGVAFAPDGGVTVADTFDDRVERFGADGAYAGQYGLISASTGFATRGSATGQFDLPRGVAYDASGNLWVADTGNDRVVELSPAGAVLQVVGGLSSPAAVAAGACGVVIADTGHGEVDWLGHPSFTGLSHPDAVACDGSTIYAADDSHVTDLSHGVQVPGAWDHPTGLAVSGGTVYVAEARRVVVVAPGGAATTLASEGTGTGQVDDAAGLALSPDGRTLLVADAGNDRVLRFDAPGVAVPRPPQLTVSVQAVTRGRVTSDPPGIECATDCFQHYGSGSRVVLTAAPVAGSSFAGWTGACGGVSGPVCALTLSGDANAGAVFVATPAPTPAPASTPAPPPPPPPKPVALSSLRVSPRTLRTRSHVSVRLTRAAVLTVKVQAARDGRRRGSKCVAPRRGLRVRCTRYVSLRGSRTIHARAGTFAFTLKRAWAGRRLSRGRYRLAITALDAGGNRVGPYTVTFTVAS